MLRYFLPIYDPEVADWALDARLLRWLTLLWLFIGLAILFSASYSVADIKEGSGFYYFIRQAIWIWLGLIGFNVIVRSPLAAILKVTPLLLLLVLGLIIATHIPGLGREVNGATRWIALGPVALQPSELMKPLLVLQSAKVFGDWHRLRWNVRLGWIGVFCVVLASILLQPNLSTTALCGMTIWLIALASGLPFYYLGSTALLGILTAVVSISIKEYQRLRVISFLNPWADPMGNGYQLVQSLLAIGSGGTLGTGYGLSQQKLFYLPFAETDFIFAVFAEEFGFIGSIILLIFLLIYATLALMIALRCRHRVKRLIAIGVMVVMVGQALLNIGVASGALPTTGLPLPLFSYGGSSTLASLMLAGFLIRVARENHDAKVIPLKTKST